MKRIGLCTFFVILAGRTKTMAVPSQDFFTDAAMPCIRDTFDEHAQTVKVVTSTRIPRYPSSVARSSVSLGTTPKITTLDSDAPPYQVHANDPKKLPTFQQPTIQKQDTDMGQDHTTTTEADDFVDLLLLKTPSKYSKYKTPLDIDERTHFVEDTDFDAEEETSTPKIPLLHGVERTVSYTTPVEVSVTQVFTEPDRKLYMSDVASSTTAEESGCECARSRNNDITDGLCKQLCYSLEVGIGARNVYDTMCLPYGCLESKIEKQPGFPGCKSIRAQTWIGRQSMCDQLCVSFCRELIDENRVDLPRWKSSEYADCEDQVEPTVLMACVERYHPYKDIVTCRF